VDVTSKWGVPIISWFCSHPPKERVPEPRKPETVGLCEMMASLVRQLMTLLPEELPDDAPDLSAIRFGRLDGTLRTWEEMLQVFADLLSLAPPDLLVVLDGLDRLDSQYTSSRTEQLVTVICRRVDRLATADAGVMKVLLTTAGHCRGVVPCLRPGEHFVREEIGGRRRATFMDL